MTAKENEKLFFEWLASTSPKKNEAYQQVFPELDRYCKYSRFYDNSIFSIINPTKVSGIKDKIANYSELISCFSSNNSHSFQLFQSALSLYKDYLQKVFIPKYRSTPIKEKSEKAVDPVKTKKDPLVKEIERQHLSYIDKRPAGGCLWIIADISISSFITDCKAKGYVFKYKAGGSNCSKRKPCWWLDEAASQKIKLNTEGNKLQNEKPSGNIEKNLDADAERIAFDALLSEKKYQPLKEALHSMGIQTIPALKSITLWNFMSNRNLYSVEARRRICAEVNGMLLSMKKVPHDTVNFIIKAWGQEFSGATPSLAFASFLSEYAVKYPSQFRSRVGGVHIKTNRIVINKYIPARGKVLKLSGENGFIADDLTPELVKTYVEWIQQRSRTKFEVSYEMVQSGSTPDTANTGNDFSNNQAKQKTITEAIFDILHREGKPLTVSEIYQAIVRDGLYSFGAQDPKSVVNSKIYLACRQTDTRISEGKNVLIKIEENGRKKFQVMTAEEAAAHLKHQPKEPEHASAVSWSKYEIVLKQAFPKGFQKESGLDMKKLRKRWEEIHGDELEDSDEAIHSQLASHCIDTGKRWYLAELLLTENDRQLVLQYIDRTLSSGKLVLYYSSIYSALEQELESAILTQDLLVSYLQATCQERYILFDSYLTNDSRVEVDLADEIKDVMVAYGRPIHMDELKRALHHFPPDRIERTVRSHPEFILDSNHIYFHESMADLTEKELDQISALIQENLDEQGYMVGDWIKRDLTRLYPETAERLSFLTWLGVRGVVAYKLQDRFSFSDGPVITEKGKTMNINDVFTIYCQTHAPFSLKELEAFASECNSPIHWEIVYQNSTRISENEFVSNGVVNWNISHIDAAIALHCPGKYTSLKSIQFFDAFPFVGSPWNSYLLEQYVATVSKDFMLMHSSFAKNAASGAIVHRNTGFNSFDEVLADVLANAPISLENDLCLEYLVKYGYINKKKLSKITEIITRAKMFRSQKG